MAPTPQGLSLAYNNPGDEAENNGSTTNKIIELGFGIGCDVEFILEDGGWRFELHFDNGATLRNHRAFETMDDAGVSARKWMTGLAKKGRIKSISRPVGGKKECADE